MSDHEDLLPECARSFGEIHESLKYQQKILEKLDTALLGSNGLLTTVSWHSKLFKIIGAAAVVAAGVVIGLIKIWK